MRHNKIKELVDDFLRETFDLLKYFHISVCLKLNSNYKDRQIEVYIKFCNHIYKYLV